MESVERHLDGDEDDYHPLQPQAVLLTQVAPHQVRQLCAVFKFLVHNLQTNGLWSVSLQRTDVWSDLSRGGGVSYVDPAVDAEELAGLVVDLLQVFSVPVEIRREEEVGPQVNTVSARGGTSTQGLKEMKREFGAIRPMSISVQHRSLERRFKRQYIETSNSN